MSNATIKKKNGLMAQLGTLIALLLLCVVLAIASPNFLNFRRVCCSA